jgi:uncharacterized NAD(P)/FAD-binding protein YdhS
MADAFTPSSPQRFVIVGGGCAGLLVAAQTLRRASAPTEVVLIERNPPIGRGVAYATDCGEHRLNVPAGRMSALPEAPAHFLDWARARAGRLGFPDTVSAEDFLPRWMYGHYLAAVLDDAQQAAARGVTLTTIVGEVVDLEDSASGPRITLADGRILPADAVVLALGLLPGEYPIRRPLPFYRSPRYLHSPLLPTVLSGVNKTDDILIVGAGLTAVDIIVQCRQLGNRGVIHAMSRRGLRPQAQRRGLESYPPFLFAESLPATVRETLRAVRGEVRRAAARGWDWRAVVDSIRPVSATLWQGFSGTERSRFMRHLRPFWEAHRHRIPPETAAIVAEMEAQGRLVYHAGRLVSLRDTGEGVAAIIRTRGTENFSALRVAKVINCTGPRTDYSKYQHPLLINLLARGLIGHDPLALGIAALPTGEVCRYGGGPVGWLFTLGAPLKGILWESTAVPEIREQARALADRLVALHPVAAGR